MTSQQAIRGEEVRAIRADRAHVASLLERYPRISGEEREEIPHPQRVRELAPGVYEVVEEEGGGGGW